MDIEVSWQKVNFSLRISDTKFNKYYYNIYSVTMMNDALVVIQNYKVHTRKAREGRSMEGEQKGEGVRGWEQEGEKGGQNVTLAGGRKG